MHKGYTVSLLIALFSAAVVKANSDHWALLVAGSEGIWNYRHQADVCHSYQLLIKNGIPQENIIVMAYDDMALNEENPITGSLFNKPDGDDVYAGCKIDYKTEDVTPENFLAVLRGDEAATKGKRVLKSTENSRVFVYFSDHGSPGLL